MMNLVVLTGRITKKPEIIATNNGYKRSVITLAVPRIYKNSNGEYETDFIRCILWNSIAEHTCEYCSKGDMVGIKGRLETNTYTKDDEVKYETNVIAERVTFLTNRKISEETTYASEEEIEE